MEKPTIQTINRTERKIDDELRETFPASDPPSWSPGTAAPKPPPTESGPDSAPQRSDER